MSEEQILKETTKDEQKIVYVVPKVIKGEVRICPDVFDFIYDAFPQSQKSFDWNLNQIVLQVMKMHKRWNTDRVEAYLDSGILDEEENKK